MVIVMSFFLLNNLLKIVIFWVCVFNIELADFQSSTVQIFALCFCFSLTVIEAKRAERQSFQTFLL